MKNTELQIIDSTEFGIESSRATTIESSFLPKKVESDGFVDVYNSILLLDIESEETAKQARELRLKLVKVRTGISDIHKAEKAFFLASGKYVDALKNKLTLPVQQMEDKLSEIEKYQETKEKERKEQLKADRLLLLAPYEVDTTFVDIINMGDDQFNQFLEVNKTAFESKKEAERLAEEKRIEDEKNAELKRLEEEKAKEAERLRIEAENKKLKEEADRLEKEREKERKKEEAALLKIKQESEKKQKEQDDLLKAEREKSEKIQAELKAEREEKERKESEERRIKKESEEKQKAEEKAKLLAPDKEKINALYLSLKNFEYPEVSEIESKEIVDLVKLKISEAMSLIVIQAKKLK